MAVNTQAGSPAAAPFSALIAALTGAAGKVLRGVSSTVGTLQDARMIATLSEMSDVQLTQIGITRSDIPRYAEKLMARD